ncbi:hypothetical protein [Sphingomonas hankyongi]|uniref:Uncharacterized protein n=1 Tax=Sphingomonas hankyongi TaxID=2908209 RepID=A0ABT0S075_9SPHN|nr:hypothetical protein [Sphingomonas hankyongi]MCL6729258.1 hypothetical protein [Sphingomonas hankyongi]
MPAPKTYFERRAAQERDAASQASDERAAQAHLELAERYAKLAEGGGEIDTRKETGAVLTAEFRILP